MQDSYEHSLLPNPSPAVLSFLHSHLPHSLPLLRRVQHPHKTNDAILISSIDIDINHNHHGSTNAPFAMLFFDATEPRGIDASLFTSVELLLRDEDVTEQVSGECKRHLAAVLSRVNRQWTRPAQPYGGHVDAERTSTSPPGLFLVGSVHHRSAALLRNFGTTNTTFKSIVRDDLAGNGGPYVKHIFRTRPLLDISIRIPSELEFCHSEDNDLDKVVSLNPFARRAVIKAYDHVGLREKKTREMVAWAFWGFEGSTRTVHCDPAWRRRGLAKAVVVQLAKEMFEKWKTLHLLENLDDMYQHMDVGHDNTASNALAASVGAAKAWEAYWLLVDFDRLPATQ